MGLVSCSEGEVLTEVNTQSEPALQVNTEEKALETHAKLVEGFKQSATRGAASIYPDYYGGCFINDQKQLVVLTTNESGQVQMMSMANADNLVFKTCEYSYNYLNQVMDELNDYQAKNDNDISNNFLLYYLSESQNAVIVEMQECYPSKIDEFKRNVSDSPAIQFKQATSKPIDLGAFEESQNTETSTRATSLYAGYPIIGTVRLDNKTYTGSASIGYRVSCDNAKGFITAGHAVSLGQEVKADDEKIGVCDLYDYKDGGTVDAAFVKVDDSSMLTNKFGTTGSNISTEIAAESLLVEGAKIVKFGGNTSYSEGEILSTNVAVTTELPNNTKRRVTFHISTTLDAEKGDSGGPVLTRSGYKLVGILKARTELDNGTIVTALTRASEIKKKFYCETY